MNQPPPPIGFGTPNLNDPCCEQPLVNNVEAEQRATLDEEARMRRERNEAEYRQEVDRGLQADKKRQEILGTIARAGQADKAADEEKKKQERAKRDENRMKQKNELEKRKQEAEQKLASTKDNEKEARAAFEKTLADDEANSRQRINAQDEETKKLIADREAVNTENRRKRDEERAARQAQHDRRMAEEQKGLVANQEREEDYRKRIRDLELEEMRPMQIMNLPIGPPPPVPLPNAFSANPVPQSAIAPPPPVYSQTHTQTQYNTRTVESVMNQQQPQETHSARSPENIKEIMNAIETIDEMLRKGCKQALEYIPKYYDKFDDRISKSYSEYALKSIAEEIANLYGKLSELKSITGETEPIKSMLEDVTDLEDDSKKMLDQLPNCSNLAPEERTKLFENLKGISEYYCLSFDEFKSSMQ